MLRSDADECFDVAIIVTTTRTVRTVAAACSIHTADISEYTGFSGTGKSRTAYAENPDCYIKNSNKWWDGYRDDQDQPSVLIEEWDPSLSMMASFMKKWADHYPFNTPATREGGSK